ncbi:peptidyl-prolyl cis-trans isomerase FKBP16-1, chloroplastic [Panicum miliaceum]|uniref:peptidylprolyl isomerase n=1 Tax=Panicum miliaceum TaxID=4540 RepID=A0A3L6RR80_PANMI|nr:peptidyl-prolyl cis-trans isomerase FKBP16-1, chloroplastic [Panicum miliaceum]
MESASLTSLGNPFPCTSQSPRYRCPSESKKIRLACRRRASPLKATCEISRRRAVSGMVVLGAAASCIDPLALPVPAQAAMPEPDVVSTVDQFSGESKPVTLPLGGEEMIRGLKDVLIGMKAGGKRRALIPPEVGYISETLKPIPEEFGPRRSLLSHAKEPLVFEVQLLKVL